MKKYLQSLLFLFVSTSLLTACGGGGDSSSAGNSNALVSATELIAVDAIVRVEPDQIDSYVDLRSYITSNSDEEIELSELNFIPKAENAATANECIAKGIDGIGFDITITAPTFCKYRYTAVIKNKSISTSADIIVVASTNDEVSLDPVSISMVKNEGFVINIADKLGSAYPEGYKLQAGTLHEVIDGFDGNGGNSFTEDLAKGEISYQGSKIGAYRLTYTLQGATAGDIKIGSVFISVSDTLNQSITAGNKNYFNITVDQKVEVELSELVSKNATACDIAISCDDDDIELRYVAVNPQGQGRATATIDSNSSMKFTFSASSTGNYSVVYVVTDKSKDGEENSGENRGAFAVGMIDFEVKGASFAKWYPQYHNQYLFTAPLTTQEALLLNNDASRFEDVEDPHSYTPSQQIAAFHFSEAKKECESISGRTLPTSAQLSAFAQAIKPLTLGDHWPMGRFYWSSDNKLVNLHDGAISEPMEVLERSYYVTCVIKVTHYLTSTIITEPKEGGFEINETVNIKIHVTDSFEKSLSGVVITAEISAGNGSLTTTTATTDNNGDAIFSVTSAEVGDVTLRFIDGNMSITETVTFISSIPWNNLQLKITHLQENEILPAGLNAMRFHTLTVCLVENSSGIFKNVAVAGIEVQFFGDHPHLRVKDATGQFSKEVNEINKADVQLTDASGCISNYQIALTGLTRDDGSSYEVIPFYVRVSDFNNYEIDKETVELQYSSPLIEIPDPEDPEKTSLIFIPPLLCNGTCTANDKSPLSKEDAVEYRLFTWNKQKQAVFEEVLGGFEYCRDLVFGGYDDWRLPTVAELKAIRQAVGSVGYEWVNTTAYHYWASDQGDSFVDLNGQLITRHYAVKFQGAGKDTQTRDDTFLFVTCTRAF